MIRVYDDAGKRDKDTWPRRRFPRAVKCRDLYEQPRHDTIRDRDLVNVASLQLGEEVAKIQFLLFVRSDLLRA